jgi:hypothetical protein
VQETPPYLLILCLIMFLSSSSGDVGAAVEHIRPRSVVFALDYAYASLASSSTSLPCLFFLFFAESSDLGRSAAMAVCGSHYTRWRADLETR